MSFVLDASAAIAWLMPDERGFDLTGLLERHRDILAPILFWTEIRAVLLMAERRGRIEAGTADHLLDQIDALGIAYDTRPSSRAVLALARRHGLTVYDAAYLELAIRNGVGLVTQDRPLSQAARAEGVSLLPEA